MLDVPEELLASLFGVGDALSRQKDEDLAPVRRIGLSQDVAFSLQFLEGVSDPSRPDMEGGGKLAGRHTVRMVGKVEENHPLPSSIPEVLPVVRQARRLSDEVEESTGILQNLFFFHGSLSHSVRFHVKTL